MLMKSIIFQMLWWILLGFFSAVASEPCYGVTCSELDPSVKGSLTLHFTDKTTFKINYESSSRDCKIPVTNLPKKRITKVD